MTQPPPLPTWYAPRPSRTFTVISLVALLVIALVGLFLGLAFIAIPPNARLARVLRGLLFFSLPVAALFGLLASLVGGICGIVAVTRRERPAWLAPLGILAHLANIVALLYVFAVVWK